MTFGIYLKEKLGTGELNPKLIIAKLQLTSSVFEKLDPVTLSRWINERTTPTLEKQLLVVHSLESRVYPFLKYISAPSVSRSHRKTYEAVFDNVESSYHSILAHRDASTSELVPRLERLTWNKLMNLVPGFFESTRSYERVLSNGREVDFGNVTFCSLRNDSKVISHLSVSSDVEYLKTIFGSRLDIDFGKSSIVFNIGYFVCREHYNLLFGTLLNYICSEYKKVDYFYMMVRGTDFLGLVESFGGEIISANKESDIVGNIYLVKLNLLKTLSNPFVFSLLKESYSTYPKLVENI